MTNCKLMDDEKLAVVQHLLISTGYDQHSKLERIVEVILEMEDEDWGGERVVEVPRN